MSPRTLGHRRANRIFLLLSATLAVVQLALIPVPREDNHLLSSDGVFYYAYLRSALLDRDLDIANDVELYNARVEQQASKVEASYAFSVGPALLWSPVFASAHGAILALHRLGVPVATDGFSVLEEGAVSFASLLYALLGLFLLYRTATRFTSERAALTASVVIFLASWAVYYAVFEPTMSHTLELFTLGLFSHVVLGTSRWEFWRGLACGLVGGLLVLVRWQNAVFLLLLLEPGVKAARPSRYKSLTAIAGFAAGFLALVSLQLAFWRATHGALLLIPQGSEFLTPASPHLLEVLFSTRHGLFTWTPIALVGVVGLVWLRPTRLAALLGVTWALDVYVCAIASDWWGGDSFGMRRLTGALMPMLLGLAALVETMAQTLAAGGRRVVHGVALVLVTWNLMFVAQYRLGYIPRSEPLTVRQLLVDKFLMPAAILKELLGR